MVKFFLREQMARLKVQAPLKKQQKKPLDYRLVIYKKMLNLVKAEHSIMIQKLIRKIKQKKTKEVNGKEPHPQISKLNQKFTYLKGIKQQTIREIVIYIMTEVLKLEKMQKVFQKNKLSIELAQLKQKTEGSEAVKYFIQKLSMLTAYQKQLQKSAQLVDTVAEKRVLRKGQLKQRRVQKKIQKKMIKEELNQKPNLTNQKRQVLDQQVGGNLLPRSKLEQFQSKQSRKIKDHKYSKQNLVGKQKPIKKQRTQFKKTGRNKAKQQKLQKKYGNYSSQKVRQPQHIHSQSSQKQYFIKKDMHPSWQAKKQLKNQMFIQPFQGKKILL